MPSDGFACLGARGISRHNQSFTSSVAFFFLALFSLLIPTWAVFLSIRSIPAASRCRTSQTQFSPGNVRCWKWFHFAAFLFGRRLLWGLLPAESGDIPNSSPFGIHPNERIGWVRIEIFWIPFGACSIGAPCDILATTECVHCYNPAGAVTTFSSFRSSDLSQSI